MNDIQARIDDDDYFADRIDDARALIDNLAYCGSSHYHNQLDGPGILIHNDDCFDDDPIYVASPRSTDLGGEYGPRHHPHPVRRTDR